MNNFNQALLKLCFYLCKLCKCQLKATGVVGDPLSFDPLHGILQDPLVPHIGLHKVLKARDRPGAFVKLEGKGKED